MRTIYKALFLSILFLPVYVAAEQPLKTETCIVADKAQVISFFDRWNDALKSKDPEKVTETYAEKAVLLPTLSNGPLIGHAQIKDYFVKLLKKSPVATINSRSIESGCNWAMDMGLYTFRIMDGGKKQFIKARYSYVYENIDGKWLIVHHHSSLMPAVSEK